MFIFERLACAIVNRTEACERTAGQMSRPPRTSLLSSAGAMRLRSSSWSILALALFAGLGNGACEKQSTISCPTSVAAACAASTSNECLPTWSAVLAGKSCSTDGYPDSTYICGSYEVHRIQDVDTDTLSFYDPASGALIAIVSGNNGVDACQGGPADFPAPSCSNPTITLGTCPDAGTDSGH